MCKLLEFYVPKRKLSADLVKWRAEAVVCLNHGQAGSVCVAIKCTQSTLSSRQRYVVVQIKRRFASNLDPDTIHSKNTLSYA